TGAGASFFGGFAASGDVDAAIRVPIPTRTTTVNAVAQMRAVVVMGATPRARVDTAGRNVPEPANDTTESTHAGGTADPVPAATAVRRPAERAMPRRCNRSRKRSRPRSSAPFTTPADQPSSAAASSRLLPSR